MAQDKKTTGRLSRLRRPSLRVSFLEKRRSSLVGAPPQNETAPVAPAAAAAAQTKPSRSRRASRKSQTEHAETIRVSFLDKERSSFINEILGHAPHNTGYHLGDVGREEHMQPAKGFEESLVAIAQLKEMDHAFVQRSNGEWRYSIVVSTSKADTGADPFIKFLVDDKGHTKEIPLRQWTKLIRLPIKTEDDDNLDSQADLMLSSMAVDGGDDSSARNLRKFKSDPEVQKPRAKGMEDRRNSESCVPKRNRRMTGRRRQKVCPTSSSFTSARIDLGSRRDSNSGATVATSKTSSSVSTRMSASRHRYSDMDALKGSWRLSSVDKELQPELVNTSFDIKFNQSAFLAALSSINETSMPI